MSIKVDLLERVKNSRIVRALGVAGTVLGGISAIVAAGAASYGAYIYYYVDPIFEQKICLQEFSDTCYEANNAFTERLSNAAFDRDYLLKIKAEITEAPHFDDRECSFPFEDDGPYLYELPLDEDCEKRAFIEFEPEFWDGLSTTRYGGGVIRALNGAFDVGVIDDFIWAEDQPLLTSTFLFQLKYVERLD